MKADKLLLFGFKYIKDAQGIDKVLVECLTCQTQYSKRIDKIFSKTFTCEHAPGTNERIVDKISHEQVLNKIKEIMEPYFIIHKEPTYIKDTVGLECKNCGHKFDRYATNILYPFGNRHKTSTRCPVCKYPDKKVKKYKHKKSPTAFTIYEYIVRRISNINNELYLHYDNNDQNHMDHNYSVSDGYHNGIEPWIIGSPVNLRLIARSENLHKNSASHITLPELYKAFFEWVGTNSDYFERTGMLGLLMTSIIEEKEDIAS
jgi:hypothetical protein